MFLNYLQSNPDFYITWVILCGFSVCVHEYSHAAAAYHQGDDTAARNGHLTLNPLVQMGKTSLIFLFVFGLAWGMVPVTPNRMRKHYSAALVALAGPLSNLFLCLVFCAVTAIALVGGGPGVREHRAMLVPTIGAQVNAVLFLLNMLPLPMLDGWSVYSHIWPELKTIQRRMNPMHAFIALAVFLIFGSRLLWRGADFLAGSATRAFRLLGETLLG